MRTRVEAEREAERIGFEDGMAEFETAVEASMRDWPAWRIAQHFNLPPSVVFELGGPSPTPEEKGRSR